MAKTLPWTPWHQVVDLRDDVRTGELSLSAFAADLYEVAMQAGERPIYEDPAEFFALTYPTYNLRELARDVVLRLAGQSTKAVRQLELTYGGGKTHSLITLYHLVNAPDKLPDLPAVNEFVQHIGQRPPQARVVVLPFDKLDVEKGMAICAPNGKTRWLKHPWSILAYQIAGDEGLRLLHAEGEVTERVSAPAENLLLALLRIPEERGEPTLLLIDEVLMYAREKVGLDPAWRGRLLNFFQYLTQAVIKVDHCAMVASLLATDPRKSDQLGKELTQELYTIFRRESEKGVQPVQKEDVAEVLRRRFFTPTSLQQRDAFKSHVVAALKGIRALDEQTAEAGKAAEDRFLQSYPFHPDLTNTLYTKWTSLEGFQRTRGVLRTFALALREAEIWDTAPLIGASVFLSAPDDGGLSEAARELTSIAEKEEYEGKRQEWSAILLGELEKAGVIQAQYPMLRHRELERAVFATFLHSQPIGQKAYTRDLLVLLGQTRPDRIELEKALHGWTEVSWFLDEDVMEEDVTATEQALPRAWRLGTKPNLTQMHHDACENRVRPEMVEQHLLQAIERLNNLTAGAKGAGARVHMLPDSPADVKDDGAFHYVILPPEAACQLRGGTDQISELARRFLTQTTTPDRPRVNDNALVLVAPSVTGLAQARENVRQYLGWEEVRKQLQKQEIREQDPIRWEILRNRLRAARNAVPGAIRQAYTVVVTMSEQKTIEAFRVKAEDRPLFSTIKADRRARIQETAINAEALLPGGPYALWAEGETARWLKDLVGAFAENPRLPKMLNRRAILETLVQGCAEGRFVLRLQTADAAPRTFWRTRPPADLLDNPAMEVVLPEAATLADLSSALLVPDALPGLWETPPLTLQTLYDYFAGGHVVYIEREGYEEPVTIPAAPPAVIDTAVEAAVEQGQLWLLSEPASIWAQPVPAGLITPDAELWPPPASIPPADLLPVNLPHAWRDDKTTALALHNALSKQAGKTLPWPRMREAIDSALKVNFLELAVESGPWPCDSPGAQNVRLRVPSGPPPPPPPPDRGVLTAEAELAVYELQDLAEKVGELLEATAGYDLTFRLRIELGEDPPDEMIDAVNEVLGDVLEDLKLE
jgi:hypothetical protein